MPSSSWSSSTSLGLVGSEDESITIIRNVGTCLPRRHGVTSQKIWIFGITLCYPQVLQTKACSIHYVNFESMGLSTGNIRIFYVLLTEHHGTILVNHQLDAQILSSIYLCKGQPLTEGDQYRCCFCTI
jgi:hypothetical protein